MFEFLSDGWFELVHEGVRGTGFRCLERTRASNSRSCRGGGSIRWCEVIEDGQVAAWGRGTLEDADVEIRWRIDDAFAILRGNYAGVAAAEATTIAERRPGGST